MKFLGALHSLRHNNEIHLERGTFLCTHFSLHYSQSAIHGRTSCAGDPPHIWETVSPALIQSPQWRGLTQPGLFYRDGRVWKAISVFSWWLSWRLKFKRSFNFDPGDWVYLERSSVSVIYVKERIGKTGVKHLCGDNEQYYILYTHAIV